MAIRFRKDADSTEANNTVSKTVYQNPVHRKYTDIDEWNAFIAAKNLISSCSCGCCGDLKLCRNTRVTSLYYSLRNYLIDKNMKFFKRIALLTSKRIGAFRRSVTIEDSVSSAVLAGIQSVMRYDPVHGSNASFTTFAYLRIRGEIFDELRRMQDFSNCIAELRRDIYPKIQCITHILGRFPTTEDLRDVLSDEDFEKCMNPLAFSSVRIISDVFEDGTGIDSLITSSQARRDAGVRRSVQVNAIDLDSIIGSDQLKSVIFMYYYLGMPLSEIALVEGISISGASKRKRDAEDKIKEYFGDRVNMVNFMYSK